MDRDELRSTLEQLVMAGHYAEAREIISQVLSKEESPALRAEAKRQESQILTIRGQWDEAARELEEAVSLATEAEDYEALSDCLSTLGDVRGYQGSYDDAEHSYVQALELAREHSNRRGEAEAPYWDAPRKRSQTARALLSHKAWLLAGCQSQSATADHLAGRGP